MSSFLESRSFSQPFAIETLERRTIVIPQLPNLAAPLSENPTAQQQHLFTAEEIEADISGTPDSVLIDNPDYQAMIEKHNQIKKDVAGTFVEVFGRKFSVPTPGDQF